MIWQVKLHYEPNFDYIPVLIFIVQRRIDQRTYHPKPFFVCSDQFMISTNRWKGVLSLPKFQSFVIFNNRNLHISVEIDFLRAPGREGLIEPKSWEGYLFSHTIFSGLNNDHARDWSVRWRCQRPPERLSRSQFSFDRKVFVWHTTAGYKRLINFRTKY